MVKPKRRVQPGRGSTSEAESVSASKGRGKAAPTKKKSITSSKPISPIKKKAGAKVTKKSIPPTSTKKTNEGETKKEKKSTAPSSKSVASKKATKGAKATKKSSPSAKPKVTKKTIKKKTSTATKKKPSPVKKAKKQGETSNESKNDSPPSKECDFYDVDISFDSDDTVTIKTINMNDHEEKTITVDLDEPSEIENAAKEFNGKYTLSLGMDIWQSDEESADLPNLQLILPIIGTIHPTKELNIHIDGCHDYSQFLRDFVPSIVQSLLPTAEVELKWKCNVPQNEQIIREILQSLPKVKDLKVQYLIEEGNDYSKSKTMMDDTTLAHLVSSCTEHARLPDGHNCTAQGVINVFDSYCSSPDKKFIMFWVHEEIVNELVELAEEKYEVIEGFGQNVVVDESTGKKMVISGCQSQNTRCIVFDVRLDRSED